jgi:protein SCO1/2
MWGGQSCPQPLFRRLDPLESGSAARVGRSTLRAIALLLPAALSLAAATRYPVTGIVLQVDRQQRSFVASCAAIPGYMEAMAMPYSVLDHRELANLKPGAYVDFTLVVEKERSYAEGIRIHRYESSEREPLLARRLQLLEAPRATVKPGDAVPDFTLTDQTGRSVSLSQLAGKVVAVTFIYTSCPLPDYCFRLSNNLSQLNQRFSGRMGRDLVLLSISFDPVRDQPKVLAKYASTFKADPETWRFLTGPLDKVKAVTRQFGLNYWPEEGYVTHTLHTLVIDRQGRLAADFEGNQFTARQLGDYVEVLMGPRP